MKKPGRNHSPVFKAWLAVEANRSEMTVAEIAAHLLETYARQRRSASAIRSRQGAPGWRFQYHVPAAMPPD